MGKRKDNWLKSTLASSRGFGMVESVVSVAILSGIALVASIYLTSSRAQMNRVTNLSGVTNIAAMIGQAIVTRSAGGAVINNATMCTGGGAVSSSATATLDPFCCTAGGDTHCTAQRRALLCGTYDAASQYETQWMRTSATWARNLYSACKSSTCGIGDASGANICSGSGLIFNDATEISNFFAILPDPQTPPTGVNIDEIRLKIEPTTVASMDSGPGCTEPTWTLNHVMKVTLTVIVPGLGQGGRQTSSTHSMHLVWPRDAFTGASMMAFNPSSPPSLQSWFLDHSGPNQAVDTTGSPPYRTSGSNSDNINATAGTQNVYNKDGTVRAANTMCSGAKQNAGLLYQDPGPGIPTQLTYVGWDKFVYGATSKTPGVVPYCGTPGASPASTAGALNMCCESIAGVDVFDESVPGGGTIYFVAFANAVPEGTITPVGQMDSMGNKTISQNIMSTPGYCPPTNSYCADGSRTGLEVAGQADGVYQVAGSGVGRCPASGTWPAYTPTIGGATDIYCHPHDGCWGMCPDGTRTQQSCPVSTTSYCSVGYNMGPRGCGAATVNPNPAIDCTLDNRAQPGNVCGDNVCDDCGHDTCANSTVPFTTKNAGQALTAPFPLTAGPWGNYTPYADGTNFPGSYIGNTGDLVGGCPATTTYCPVGSWLPASATNPPGNIYYLPKDNCGNSCPDGTRIYQTCPADRTSYCSLDPAALGSPNQDVIRVAVPGSYGGSRGPRCSGAQCSNTAPNNTPRDDCGQYCLPSTYVPQSSGCPATNTYCPDSSPSGAIPSPLNGGSGPNWLPHDYCGNDCPVGTLPAPDGTAHDGCLAQSAYCYDPDGSGGGEASCVGAIQPGSEPKDVCGRTCLMTSCVCPDPDDVCQGITYYTTTGGACSGLQCSVVGAKPWTTQSDSLWCPVDGAPFASWGAVNDSAGHTHATAWCDDIYTGHHHTIDVDGSRPTTCPTEKPLWCVGDPVNDDCGDPCAGGGTKPFAACDAQTNWCTGYDVPDAPCVDAHGTHYNDCGPGSKTWTLCGAVGSQPCGTLRVDTCTDGYGAHSTNCSPVVYNGFNSTQCDANGSSTSCASPAADNCGNIGCGWGDVGMSGGYCGASAGCSVAVANGCWSAGNEMRVYWAANAPAGSWPCTNPNGQVCRPNGAADGGSCSGTCYCVYCIPGH